MEVIINFNVRNPEWFWGKSEERKMNKYRDEWALINEGQVLKHVPSWSYKIAFDVLSVEDNRNATFLLRFKSDPAGERIENEYQLENCTHIKLVGENKFANVVVSNDLIHQYMGVKKPGHRYYLYFFIKENVSFTKVDELIFVSEQENKKIKELIN